MFEQIDKKGKREFYFTTENEYNTQVYTEERELVVRLTQGIIEEEKINSYEVMGCKEYELEVFQELNTILVAFIATVLIIKNTHELNKEKRKR